MPRKQLKDFSSVRKRAYENNLPVHRAFYAGESAISIAHRLGITRTHVYKKVRYVDNYGRGERKLCGYSDVDYRVIGERNSLICSLYYSGIPCRIIARHFGLCTDTINRIIREGRNGCHRSSEAG